MSNPIESKDNRFQADCSNCFGLCCVALPFAKSADFSFDKIGGTPCPNLQSDYRCSIHQYLREKGHRGCAVYECFGAGQKVSQDTYTGNNWRNDSERAKEMFRVFPIMQQLHEILYYLNEALQLRETESIHKDLHAALEETERLSNLPVNEILELNIHKYRATVNELLIKASERVRAKGSRADKIFHKKIGTRADLIGVNLKGANLRGANLRGVLLIASDLRKTDMRNVDFIGADLRDADLRGANLTESIFLTQAQINAANGDSSTKLPTSLKIPDHWPSVS